MSLDVLDSVFKVEYVLIYFPIVCVEVRRMEEIISSCFACGEKKQGRRAIPSKRWPMDITDASQDQFDGSTQSGPILNS